MDKTNSKTPLVKDNLQNLQFESLFYWKNILEMRNYEIKELNDEIASLPNIDVIEETYENYKSSLSTIFVKSILIFGVSNIIAWKIKAKPIYIIPKIFVPISLTCGYTFYDLISTEKYYNEQYREEFQVLEENKRIRDIIIKENYNYGFKLKDIIK